MYTSNLFENILLIWNKIFAQVEQNIAETNYKKLLGKQFTLKNYYSSDQKDYSSRLNFMWANKQTWAKRTNRLQNVKKERTSYNLM